MLLSLYIHIPFCEVKCGYCDFFSVSRGFGDFDLQNEYVAALTREIDARSSDHAGRPVRSIFFGGGTPSLLDPRLLERILISLRKHFAWEDATEVTLESNPKTVSLEKLKDFRSLGINRLSIGVQSLQDRFLKVMGRIHSGQEARETVEDAWAAGFKNINIDLIYALPGQTFEDWQEDLEEALQLKTPHLSAYHLTLEPGTSFDALYRRGQLRLPSEEEGIRCLTWTRERLSTARCQAPMEPYEISNFSMPGFESVHNRNYWRYGEYLGFGTAAASFVLGAPHGLPFASRRTNVRDLKKYLRGEWAGFSEDIDLPTAMGEFCMLALRTREGIGEEAFTRQFENPLRKTYPKELEKWSLRGWLENEGGFWRLTEPGILFCDEVAASFFH